MAIAWGKHELLATLQHFDVKHLDICTGFHAQRRRSNQSVLDHFEDGHAGMRQNILHNLWNAIIHALLLAMHSFWCIIKVFTALICFSGFEQFCFPGIF